MERWMDGWIGIPNPNQLYWPSTYTGLQSNNYS